MNGNLAYDYIPDEPWEELIDGKIVAMSPRPAVNHNRVAENIFAFFLNQLEGRTCQPFGDGYDLYLSDTEHYIPDFMIVCDPNKIGGDAIYGVPDLVVEILSPSTARYDRGHKKDIYEKFGVREYWIVSALEMTIEQYLLIDGKFVLNDTYSFYTDRMLERMTEDRRRSVITGFKCSLYDDITIPLNKIFSRLV